MPEGPPDVDIDTEAVNSPIRMLDDISTAINRMKSYLDTSQIGPQHFGRTETGHQAGQNVRTNLDSFVDSLGDGQQFGADLHEAVKKISGEMAGTDDANRENLGNTDGGGGR